MARTRTATKPVARTRTATKPAEVTDTATPAPALTLAVRRSEGVKRAAKTREDNPVEEALKATLSEGPLAYDVATEDEAKKVVSLLQRAQKDLNVGLTKSITNTAPGTWTVDFCGKETKRARKYTSNDIRKWAVGTEDAPGPYGTIIGPITTEIREAYKVAHGFAKFTTEELNSQ